MRIGTDLDDVSAVPFKKVRNWRDFHKLALEMTHPLALIGGDRLDPILVCCFASAGMNVVAEHELEDLP